MERSPHPTPDLTDARLVERVATDDVDALLELVQRHSETTFAVALLTAGAVAVAAPATARAFSELVAGRAAGTRASGASVAADLAASARASAASVPTSSNVAAHEVPASLRDLLPIERVVVWLTGIGWDPAAVATVVAHPGEELRTLLASRPAVPVKPDAPGGWWD